MDEKQYRENQPGYDKDTFGEVNREQYTDGGSFYHSTSPSGGSGFGIASMVLGILALVFFCGCFNIPLAIISIILAIIQLSRKGEGKGFAIAGIVTSVVSVILTVVMIVMIYIAGFGANWWMRANTLPFEYFMDGDDYYGDDYDDYFDDHGGHSNDLSVDGFYQGQDL